MKVLTINRLQPMELPDIPERQFLNRTFGIIQVGYQALNVIERAWVAAPRMTGPEVWSLPFESCVPIGEYTLESRDSPSRGRRWHFVNDRLGICLEKDDCPSAEYRYSCMFHPANWWYDIQGCAGLGLGLADFGGEKRGWGVTSSRAATSILEQYLGDDNYARLIIR